MWLLGFFHLGIGGMKRCRQRDIISCVAKRYPISNNNLNCFIEFAARFVWLLVFYVEQAFSGFPATLENDRATLSASAPAFYEKLTFDICPHSQISKAVNIINIQYRQCSQSLRPERPEDECSVSQAHADTRTGDWVLCPRTGAVMLYAPNYSLL